MILDAFWSGILAALIMAVWIEIAAVFRLGHLNHLAFLGGLVLGRRTSHRWARLMGIIPHLLMGGVLGAFYGWLAENSLISANFSILGFLVFAVFPWLIIETTVLPLLGHGVFSQHRRLKAMPANLVIHGIFSAGLVYFLALLSA